MKKYVYLILTLLTAGCSTMPPKYDVPSYRKPKSNASKLFLEDGTKISKESDLAKLRNRLDGSKYFWSKEKKAWVWDLNGGILSGKKQSGDGGQSEDQEPLFRAQIPLILQNGFVTDNKDAALFYGENSGVVKMTFTNIGEDAVATTKGADYFTVSNSEFINTRKGADKSIQLNEANRAIVENNLVVGGITGARIHESSWNSSSEIAFASNNKFVGVNTAWNVAKGILEIKKPNSYDKVKLPFKTSNGGKIKNPDGKVKND
jgi:hypothetical protein